ncbi:hypothetical protein EBR43_13195, partial [bacterium]|nr:hypothetical protein [bacterium]
VLKILKENKTRYYCYVLLCDEEAIVVGKGSNRIDTNKIQASGRSNIIFPGGTAHGHQKALTAALGHLTSKNSLRIIVPVKEEDTALKIEEELKTVLKFGVKKGGKGVMELNEELLDKRLAQLYPGIDLNDFKNTDDFKRFRFLLKEVINPSGCEMANFKNDIYLAEQLFYPGLVKKVKDIFGGYYSDI